MLHLASFSLKLMSLLLKKQISSISLTVNQPPPKMDKIFDVTYDDDDREVQRSRLLVSCGAGSVSRFLI